MTYRFSGEKSQKRVSSSPLGREEADVVAAIEPYHFGDQMTGYWEYDFGTSADVLMHKDMVF